MRHCVRKDAGRNIGIEMQHKEKFILYANSIIIDYSGQLAHALRRVQRMGSAV